ncbi:MAG: DNA-methyltransferase, partial [Rhabdochlamydiaceae bacterium]
MDALEAMLDDFTDSPQIQVKNKTILQGQVLEQLRKLPDKFYNCIITSPPYYKIRDYGVEGQIGLEKDPLDYLDVMSQVMRQLHRILRDDGIAWINIGDCIIDGGWYGFPEMFFSNCRIQGWNSVSKPIWYKRNAMPSSTKIRFAPRYEPIYGFSKSSKYYFNLDPVRVPSKVQPKPFNLRVREGKKKKLDKKYGSAYSVTNDELESHNTLGEKIDVQKKQDSTLGIDGKPKPTYKGFNERWKRKMLNVGGQTPQGIHRRRHSGYYG